MEERHWSPEEVQAFTALGLTITLHRDPSSGWGYTWQGRDWTGPFTTPDAAVRAAFTEAREALQFRSEYSWVLFAKAGDFWRSDGQGRGWRRVVDPGTTDDEEEQREAFMTLDTLLIALRNVRATLTGDLSIAGPAKQWHKSLDAGEQALTNLEEMLQEWQEELGDQYHRGVNANEELDDSYFEEEDDEDEDEEYLDDEEEE